MIINNTVRVLLGMALFRCEFLLRFITSINQTLFSLSR